MRQLARLLRGREKRVNVLMQDGHVADVLARYRVDCVVDVGANRGQTGRRLRRLGYRGSIVSFEPVPHLFRALSDACSGDPLWRAEPVALGREEGEAEMHVVPESAEGWKEGLSSLRAPSAYGTRRYAALRELETVRVPVRRLDSVDLPGSRIYLKLDTQGYDLEVFAGLGDRVRDVVAMQSEVALQPLYEGAPTLTESLAAYQSAGLDVSGLFLISREKKTLRVVEYDAILVRADAL